MPQPRRAAPTPRGPWKQGRIPVIGVIGGIGSGKSLVAGEFAAHGVLVLDADRIGHALLDQRPAREEIVAAFGRDVLQDAPQEDGGDLAPEAEIDAKGEADERPADDRPIDRAKLAMIVFSSPEARKRLEAILHPRMRRTVEKAIARTIRQRSHKGVMIDAAILLEAGWDDLCDVVLFVDAPDDVRAARVAEHRGWTAEQLAARERSQWPLDRKKARADVVLVNDGDVESVRERIRPIWRSWMARTHMRPRTEPTRSPRSR